MNRIKFIFYSLFAFVFVVSCKSGQSGQEESPSEFIEITDAQFENDKMEIGGIDTVIFEDVVSCTGTVIPLPNGMASVSAPVPGIVKSILCAGGQFVSKGQALMEISGNEVIDIQKEFAGAAADYRRLKSEYERAKILRSDNITSDKEFLLKESEFLSAKAKYSGFKLKIEAMGLNSAGVESGEFFSSYKIKSPVSGNISSLKAAIGTYSDSRSALAEVVNPDLLQLRLSVFAADISKIKKGQSVKFKAADSDNERIAVVSSVGVSIDMDSKSIECFAAISGDKGGKSVANEFVECKVVTRSGAVMALPSDALIKTAGGYSVLVLQKQEGGNYFFSSAEVITGRTFNGFTEILNADSVGRILIKGVYNIHI